MDVQNSDEAQAYELEYPRRESNGRRGFIGFMIGLLASAFIFLMLVALMFGLALGDVSNPDTGLVVGMLVALGIAVIGPFALAYRLGRAESNAECARRRDHALGIGPPLNFWYGTTGRINRRAFIAGMMVNVLGFFGVLGVIRVGTATDNGEVSVISLVLIIPLFIAYIVIGHSLSTRRLHDLGYTRWRLITGMVKPMDSGILFRQGNNYPNK